LARLYTEAYQATHDPFFRTVVEEILTYVEREMRHTEGGFYSTQDADSEGEEGKFFTWTRDEVLRELGDDAGEVFCRYFDVTDVGNFSLSTSSDRWPTPAFIALRFHALAENSRSILFQPTSLSLLWVIKNESVSSHHPSRYGRVLCCD
jgi:uncharacterized protein YyaL (SSP411 family)